MNLFKKIMFGFSFSLCVMVFMLISCSENEIQTETDGTSTNGETSQLSFSVYDSCFIRDKYCNEEGVCFYDQHCGCANYTGCSTDPEMPQVNWYASNNTEGELTINKVYFAFISQGATLVDFECDYELTLQPEEQMPYNQPECEEVTEIQRDFDPVFDAIDYENSQLKVILFFVDEGGNEDQISVEGDFEIYEID